MKWHVWTIANNRYEPVVSFLKSVSCVGDFLYPMIEKEYKTKKGKRTRNVPLYANYLFIYYDHIPESIVVLQECRWLVNYVGPCSDEEIKRVKRLQNAKYEDLIDTYGIKKGSLVKLKNQSFNNVTAVVVDLMTEKNEVLVSLELFGSERLIKCSLDDINTEG